MFFKDFYNSKLNKVLAIFMVASAISGCGFSPEKAQTSTLQLLEDGTITQIIVDSFEKSNYDFDELQKMASSEVTAFNIAYGEDSAVINSLVQEDTGVRSIMTFATDEIYEEFNGETFFYGTVNEMLDAGYSLPGDLVTADGDAIDADTFYDKEEQHVIVLSERINIVTPYKIEYMSNGAELVNSKEADLSGVSDSLIFLLLVK